MTTIDIQVLPAKGKRREIRTAVPNVEDFHERAPEVAESITEIATSVQAKLNARDQAPGPTGWAMDSAQMTFQVALQAGAGVVIAKAAASATFAIQITWKCSQ